MHKSDNAQIQQILRPGIKHGQTYRLGLLDHSCSPRRRRSVVRTIVRSISTPARRSSGSSIEGLCAQASTITRLTVHVSSARSALENGAHWRSRDQAAEDLCRQQPRRRRSSEAPAERCVTSSGSNLGSESRPRRRIEPQPPRRHQRGPR